MFQEFKVPMKETKIINDGKIDSLLSFPGYFLCLLVKVSTVGYNLSKVSQYRKYTQTNIRIQFIRNKLTNAYLHAIVLLKN